MAPSTQSRSTVSGSVMKEHKSWFPVAVRWDVDRLGIKFGDEDEGFVVRTTAKGSWAADAKLQAGDELVSINGEHVAKMAQHECREALSNRRPLTLTFARVVTRALSPSLHRRKVSVRISDDVEYSAPKEEQEAEQQQQQDAPPTAAAEETREEEQRVSEALAGFTAGALQKTAEQQQQDAAPTAAAEETCEEQRVSEALAGFTAGVLQQPAQSSEEDEQKLEEENLDPESSKQQAEPAVKADLAEESQKEDCQQTSEAAANAEASTEQLPQADHQEAPAEAATADASNEQLAQADPEEEYEQSFEQTFEEDEGQEQTFEEEEAAEGQEQTFEEEGQEQTFEEEAAEGHEQTFEEEAAEGQEQTFEEEATQGQEQTFEAEADEEKEEEKQEEAAHMEASSLQEAPGPDRDEEGADPEDTFEEDYDDNDFTALTEDEGHKTADLSVGVPAKQTIEEEERWMCGRCGISNESSKDTCRVCSTERGQAKPSPLEAEAPAPKESSQTGWSDDFEDFEDEE